MTSLARSAFTFLCGAVMGGTAVGVYAAGTTDTVPDRAAIEAIVREYILEHPEILPEAMERLEGKRTAGLIAANRAEIERPFANAWAGNPDGDVVLVEFYDYACGYCRRSVPDLDRLIAEDRKLKIVFRELPVLGPDSETAAQISLAVAKGRGFDGFHRGLYAGGALTREKIEKAAAAAGVDFATATQASDAQREIQRNIELARGLGVTGTPSFVVGDQMLQGAVGYEALKSAVAAARAVKGR